MQAIWRNDYQNWLRNKQVYSASNFGINRSETDIEQLEEKSNTDATLAAVEHCLRTGGWDTRLVKSSSSPFKHELGLIGDQIVRGNKLDQNDLRSRMLDLAHLGHPGESVTK